MRSNGIEGVIRDIQWLVVPAVGLVALMVAVGYLVTRVLPSTAVGKWDAGVPARLVEYREHDGLSESKLMTTLSVAAIVIWHSRRRWITVAAVIACAAVPLTIAICRVYRGMHYPTDVLAGMLLGAIWLSVVIVYVRSQDAGGRRHAAVDADRRLVTG